MLALDPRFDMIEAARELVDRAAQRSLRVDFRVTGKIHEREKDVSHFVFNRLFVSARHRAVEFFDLLGNLRARATGIGPIEADALYLLADALGAGQGGKAARHAAQDAPLALLFGLDLLPIAQHFVGVLRVEIPEHMRMAMDKLFHDARDHVVNREGAFTTPELRLEHDLEEEIPKLFADGRAVSRIDRVDDLTGLFERVLTQGLERLFSVPRTAIRSQEPLHHPDETRERRAILKVERRHRTRGVFIETQKRAGQFRRGHDESGISTGGSTR